MRAGRGGLRSPPHASRLVLKRRAVAQPQVSQFVLEVVGDVVGAIRAADPSIPVAMQAGSYAESRPASREKMN